MIFPRIKGVKILLIFDNISIAIPISLSDMYDPWFLVYQSFGGINTDLDSAYCGNEGQKMDFGFHMRKFSLNRSQLLERVSLNSFMARKMNTQLLLAWLEHLIIDGL